MKGQENLIPTTERSEDEVKKMQKKGGINSGKARRDKRTMREALKILLELPMTDKDGKPVNSPLTGEQMSVVESIATSTVKAAIKGDIKAVKAIADILGENMQNISLSAGEGMTKDDFIEMIKEARK